MNGFINKRPHQACKYQMAQHAFLHFLTHFGDLELRLSGFFFMYRQKNLPRKERRAFAIVLLSPVSPYQRDQFLINNFFRMDVYRITVAHPFKLVKGAGKPKNSLTRPLTHLSWYKGRRMAGHHHAVRLSAQQVCLLSGLEIKFLQRGIPGPCNVSEILRIPP